MQNPQANFSYLLNSRFGYTGNLENERQHLIQQQKLCKARARKYLVETNQRRKASEERRKQWDIQEQLLRDNILQQRRQQVEEATQRYQRAHLPPSQRFRPINKRKNRNMEEALGQIQVDWYTQSSSVVSPTDTPSRPLSTKPSTVSKSSPRRTLTAEEAYTKLLQEHRIRKDLEIHSFETCQLSDTSISESLLSKDSLENENSDQSIFSPRSPYSSFFLDYEKLKKRQDLTPTSAPTSVSAMMLQDQNPALLEKLNKHKQESRADFEWSHNNMDVFQTSPIFPSEKQTPDSLAVSTLPNEDSKHFEAKSMINTQTHNILDTNEVDADDTKVEDLDVTEENLLNCRSQIIKGDSQLTYPSAKNIPFSSESVLETPMKGSVANNFLNDEVLLHTVKENLQRLSEKVASISINNLNKVSNLMYQTEKPINAASTSSTCLSNNQSETEKCDHLKEEDKETPDSMIATYSVSNNRLLKGILKKKSKYSSEDLCLYDSGHLILSKQVALAIRDSIELTRAKTKDVVVSSSTKKKLRWFDEVHPEKESKEQDTANQEKLMSHPTNISMDHQLSLTLENESSKSGPRMAPAAFLGYRLTKEAWADVQVQVNLAQERPDEFRALCISTRTRGSKVPRRDCNARLSRGPVSSRVRKGTIIRPQSAIEVIKIGKTQGKIMVPRPPPRTELTEENNAKQAPVTEEAPYRNNSVETYPCPICLFLDCNVNGASSSGPQEIHNNNNGRGKMNEKGLCLHITPTDEEIAQLWDGVRSALNTKDGKSKPVLQKHAPESRQVYRNSRQPPVAGSRRFLQTSQPTKQNTELIRPGPRKRNAISRNEGFERVAQFPVAEVYPNGSLKQNQPVPQIQMPERVQGGLSSLSLEEKKIMLSLDRLNHQLHCLKTNRQSKTDNNGHIAVGTPLTKESNNHKHQASSANLLHYQKKT
ncbi:centrosomal protein of 126 kDa isoform X1 [Gambusia affinis]|uniref:centrosomal protein of 126 kDa isoform X1 n=1 Tax=Gambusia affinis TaxID=33528 RepID=UPI001CDD6C87|nr:centrosomal protein of 126 kDa isoform X1 [Gambusia affinis]